MSLKSHYHLAIIYYKKKDYENALISMRTFFTEMRPLCKAILSPEKYKNLEDLKVFDFSLIQDLKLSNKIKDCLKKSADIYTAIYGDQHPYVKDYVVKNY
jgi:hypothetical protein